MLEHQNRKMIVFLTTITVIFFLLGFWAMALMPLTILLIVLFLDPKMFVDAFKPQKRFYDYKGKRITDPIRLMQLNYDSQKADELVILSKRLIVDFNIDQLSVYESFYNKNKRALDNYVRSDICKNNINSSHNALSTYLNEHNDFVSPHFVIEIVKYAQFKNQVDTMKAKLKVDLDINEIYKKYVSLYGENYNDPSNLNIFTYILKYEFKFDKIEKKEVRIEVSRIYNEIMNLNSQKEFIKMIESDSDDTYQQVTIDQIDNYYWSDFELLLERLFINMGYGVRVTKSTGDQGADLIIEKFQDKIAVQAKLYYIDNKVGNDSVQQVIAGSYYYKCNKRMVVTNSYFTKSAIELAKRSNVILVDRDRLESWLKKIQFDNGHYDVLNAK